MINKPSKSAATRLIAAIHRQMAPIEKRPLEVLTPIADTSQQFALTKEQERLIFTEHSKRITNLLLNSGFRTEVFLPGEVTNRPLTEDEKRRMAFHVERQTL